MILSDNHSRHRQMDICHPASQKRISTLILSQERLRKKKKNGHKNIHARTFLSQQLEFPLEKNTEIDFSHFRISVKAYYDFLAPY